MIGGWTIAKFMTSNTPLADRNQLTELTIRLHLPYLIYQALQYNNKLFFYNCY